MLDARHIVVFALIILFLVPAPSHGATPFAYGDAAGIPDGSVWLTYKTLDIQEHFVCPTTDLCTSLGTSTPRAYPPGLAGRGATWNRERTAAVVRERGGVGPGGYWNALYVASNGVMTLRIALPISTRVERLYASIDGNIIIAATASHLFRIDTRSGQILNFLPLDLFDRVSFSTASANGRYFAYYESATAKNPERRHVVLDLVRGTEHAVSEELPYWDLLGDETRIFEFSPDSKRLLYLDDWPGQPTLYLVDLAKQTPGKLRASRVISKPYSIADFLWWEGSDIFYMANREGAYDWRLYHLNIETYKLTEVSKNMSYGERLRRWSDYVLFSRTSANGTEAMAYHTKTGKLETFAAPSLAQDSIIAIGTVRTFGNAKGVLIKPDEASSAPRPLVIWLHGGPFRQTSVGYHPFSSYGRFDWLLDRARQSGAYILKLDYAGSYGFGRDYAESLQHNIGVRDVAQVIAAQKALAGELNISETYLMGVSYGGYLAVRSLVEEPSRFAGAITVSGVSDWPAVVKPYRSPFAVHFGGEPNVETQARYAAASITQRLNNLGPSDRVLAIHGEKDLSVPYTQADILRGSFAEYGKQLEFVSYPDEGHVFHSADSFSDVCRRVSNFLGFVSADGCSLGAGN